MTKNRDITSQQNKRIKSKCQNKVIEKENTYTGKKHVGEVDNGLDIKSSLDGQYERREKSQVAECYYQCVSQLYTAGLHFTVVCACIPSVA